MPSYAGLSPDVQTGAVQGCAELFRAAGGMVGLGDSGGHEGCWGLMGL